MSYLPTSFDAVKILSKWATKKPYLWQAELILLLYLWLPHIYSRLSAIVLISFHISYGMLQFKNPKHRIHSQIYKSAKCQQKGKKGNFTDPHSTHLVTTLVDKVRFCRFRQRDTSTLLLAISFYWTCSQNIIFLCPPHGNSSFRAFTVSMPQLRDMAFFLIWFRSRHFVVIKESFRMVTRLHLKKPK